jgi:hypothetical protein
MKIKRNICVKELHELTPDNVYIVPKTGQRYCKACMQSRRNKIKRDRVDSALAAPATINLSFPKSVWEPFAVLCIAYLGKDDPLAAMVEIIREYTNDRQV